MRMLKVSIALVFVPLVVAAADENRPPKGFKEVTPKNKAWIAWYPSDGKLRESEDSIASPKFGQIRIFRSVFERKDTSLFVVSQVIVPPKLLRAPAKARQDLFVEIACDEFSAKLKETKQIKLGTMAGKEYLLEGRGNLVRMRVYGTGAQVFRVLVVGAKEQVNSTDAETFFNSFKRTPKSDGEKKDKG